MAATLQRAGRLLPAAFAAVAASGAAWALAPGMCGASADAAPGSGGLRPDAFVDLKLIGRTQLTHNTFSLKFALPDGAAANMPVASCLLTKAPIQGPGDDAPKVVVRPYTPVSPPDAPGYLELVIKSYPTGRMSKHMAELQVGQSLAFKGPIPKYPYKANALRHIGMVAGGTGITPMLQVADAVLRDPADKTKLSLVFANVSESDILLKPQLDALAAAHPGRLSVFYVVDKPRWGGIFWKGGVGYVTRDMLAAHLPPPGQPGALVMVCGPPGMMAAVSGDKAPDKSQGELAGLLKAMGYSAEQVYKF